MGYSVHATYYKLYNIFVYSLKFILRCEHVIKSDNHSHPITCDTFRLPMDDSPESYLNNTSLYLHFLDLFTSTCLPTFRFFLKIEYTYFEYNCQHLSRFNMYSEKSTLSKC